MEKDYCFGKKDFCDDISQCNGCTFFDGNGTEKREAIKTNFGQINGMSIEELAEWLFANCEYLSAEYGACSGAKDSARMLEYLKTAEE